MKAPHMAASYYDLPEDSTLRDIFLSIRADESIHRDVNHKFAALGRRFEGDADEIIEKMIDEDPRIWHDENNHNNS
jgi:hypothetical protein